MNAVTEAKADHASIVAALAAAQSEMGKALKQSNNPAFKSKYADLGNVMEACVPALTRHGIAVIQPTGEDETGRYVETVFLHGNERLSCRVPLIVAKNDMQGYGSAVTYARRYGLMCMAGIAPEDDDGNAAAAAPPRQEDRRQPQRNDAPDPAQIAKASIGRAASLDALAAIWHDLPSNVKAEPSVIAAKDARKAALQPASSQVLDDEIPY